MVHSDVPLNGFWRQIRAVRFNHQAFNWNILCDLLKIGGTLNVTGPAKEIMQPRDRYTFALSQLAEQQWMTQCGSLFLFARRISMVSPCASRI